MRCITAHTSLTFRGHASAANLERCCTGVQRMTMASTFRDPHSSATVCATCSLLDRSADAGYSLRALTLHPKSSFKQRANSWLSQLLARQCGFSSLSNRALTWSVNQSYNPRVSLHASQRPRIAVFASGGGSNLQAIIDYFASLGAQRGGDVVLVASDRAEAPALHRAHAAGIEALTLGAKSRTQGMMQELMSRGVMHVVLAGFLQLIPIEVVQAFRGRIVNVHPALLPAFGGRGMYGERVHSAVLASGARVSGPTVHFVDEVYDRGPIIAQWPVPVAPNDSIASLAARVLAVEHLLYPRVVNALCAGRIRLGDDGRVSGVPPLESAAAFSMGDYVRLRQSLDQWLGP